MFADLLISPLFSFPPFSPVSPADLLDGIIMFFLLHWKKHLYLPILFIFPSHILSVPSLSTSLLICSVLPLSLALPAVTAFSCEPVIYHLLILDDYGALHRALICCWDCSPPHNCQLSSRQPANRPVCQPIAEPPPRPLTAFIPKYQCSGAPMTECLGRCISCLAVEILTWKIKLIF